MCYLVANPEDRFSRDEAHTVAVSSCSRTELLKLLKQSALINGNLLEII